MLADKSTYATIPVSDLERAGKFYAETLTFGVPNPQAWERVDTEGGEEFDLPGIKTVDGIAQSAANVWTAWFKDPDGNLLGLTQVD